MNKLQLGAYAEYFVKMEFTMYGFQVYSSEVNDRGIDFVCRHQDGQFYEIQVKSLRGTGYVFAQKEKFELREELLLALVRFEEGEEPGLFLIPSLAWRMTDVLLVSRDYEGLKSKPEWGINLSQRNLGMLGEYEFGEQVGRMIGAQHDAAQDGESAAPTSPPVS